MAYRLGEVTAPLRKEEALLDKKDKEIINILTINSRTPLSQIAKSIKTSTEVVSYRFANLKKRRIIVDAFAVLDPKPLGVFRYCVYLQFHSLSQEKMHSIVENLLENKHVNWLIETGGKWELILMIESIDQNKCDSIVENILAPIRGYLNDYMIAVVKNFVHKSQRYIGGLRQREEYHGMVKFPYDKEFHGKKTEADIDKKDIMLLKLLHENARQTLTELAGKLQLSRDTVDYRIKKLISTNIIKGFILRLNYHLLGFQYYTVMIKLHSISQKRKEEFFRYLYADERFYALMEQLGMWDISLMMFFTSPKDLRDFLISIKEKFSDIIHSYESVIHFNQYYYTYLCDGVVEELIKKYRS